MDMEERPDTDATDLQRGTFDEEVCLCRMQRGGRMLKFVEEDFKMSTYIVNEDGTREIQTEHASESDQVDVCGGSKPPKWIVCFIYDL